MPSFTSKTILAALAGALGVAAHGHVESINIAGTVYENFDPFTAPYQSDPPTVIGWSTTATDNGFVAPDAYGTGDIVCHRGAKNAKGHAKVAAGSQIYLKWDTWPESHKGPVLDYLASCGASGCESVDKETLKFFKIDEAGLTSATGNPGTYAADELVKNGNGWLLEIPTSIKPGFYVLRHEIIALHSAGQENGAQNYPQCFNLEITGSGTEQPEGTLATELYKADDEGILFNIYGQPTTYPIPGPAVIKGAKKVTQAKLAEKSKGTATTGSGSSSGSDSESAPAASAPAATSAPAAAEPTKTTPAATSAAAPAQESAPADESAPAAAAPTETEAPSAAQPTQATPTKAPSSSNGAGCKSKRSKKVRRHVRDVKARNVAPMKQY
ncbi:hypothetical protein ACHAPJ_005190 [Fusarium lateritium]